MNQLTLEMIESEGM